MDLDDGFGNRVDPLGLIDGIVTRLHGAVEGVFHGEERPVGGTVGDRCDDIAELAHRHRLDLRAPELLDGLFAETGEFPLKSDSKWCGHEAREKSVA